MLDQEVVGEIEQAAAEYPWRSASAIDALRIVQHHHGWISDDHLRDVARLLQLSETELEGIATFYNQLFRRPVGRHVIQICDGVICWMVEQEGIRDLFKRLGAPLGQTTEDGRFTLLPVPCLGACHRAPAMLVDGDLHEGLTVEGVEAILARYP